MTLIRSVPFWLCLALVQSAAAADKPARPATWAQPLKVPGAPNLHQVSTGLYRSAQPSAAGMRNLEKLGIKTVINLRAFHSDRDELKGTKIQTVRIPINTWHLKKKHVLKFLSVVRDPTRQPVLVHCKHGADRTGTMVAFYRMVVQGWSKSEALSEMKQGGFGFHSVWASLVEFIQEANIDEYKPKPKPKPSPSPGKPGDKK